MSYQFNSKDISNVLTRAQKKAHSAERVEIARAIRSIRSVCKDRPCFLRCVKGVLGGIPLGEGGALKSKIEGRGKAFPHILQTVLGMLCLILPLPLYILSVFLIIFPIRSAFALDVVWIDSNTVQISGVGNEWSENTTVVTNYIGTCTNCVAISRTELDTLCDNMEGAISGLRSNLSDIDYAVSTIQTSILGEQQDISGYRRWATATTSRTAEFTNYTWTVQNGQTALVRQFNYGNYSWANADTTFRQRALFYSNGIYDYANQTVSPTLTSYYNSLSSIASVTPELSSHVDTIEGVYSQLRTVPICSNEPQFVSPNGGTNGSVGVGCAWTEEQARAVVSILGEIKTTTESQLEYLRGVSNRVASVDDNIKSYGEMLKRALFQANGTIQVSSSETPMQIYESETATLYNYDHSNILQRIELLLYNLGYSGTTNSPSDTIAAIDDTTNTYPDENDISSAKDSALESVSTGVSENQTNLDRVKQLWNQILNFLSNLNGSIETVGLESWDDDFGYAVAVDDSALTDNTFKTTAITFLRLCFGCAYWFAAGVFIYYFYLKALRLGVFIAKWATEIISTIFDDV